MKSIVIGSGFGGIAAALRLKAKNHSVTLIEKHPDLGGRARVFKKNGFTFDGGPTVITAPYLINELFELFNKKPKDYIKLTPLKTWYRFIFEDGLKFDYSGDEFQMKNQIKKIATLLIGGIGFNVLFWSENLGVNLLLFSLFLISIGIGFHRESVKSKPVLISALGVLITALMVVYHNSIMAKFTCMTSILLFVGFLNQIELKAIFHAIPTSILNLGMAPVGIWENLRSDSKKEVINKKYLRTLKIVIIPILFFIVFYVIFLFSNPVFAKYSTQFWETIGIWIQGV